MKLLICTQIVDQNDPILGFFHRWIQEFAVHCEHVEVICLKEGTHALPANVHVHSLGKERGAVSKMQYAFRFWRQLYRVRHEYDAVFVHMNPEYMLLGGLYWRFAQKPTALWYVHKSVTPKLRLAVLLLGSVFSVSRESFRLQTSKLHIVGMGIDPSMTADPAPRIGGIRIITTGRIAHTKRIMEMLDVLDVLYRDGKEFTFTVVGAPVNPEDFVYEKILIEAVQAKPYASRVFLRGAVPHTAIPALLREQSVFLNLSATGSVDKAVLEALASGVPAVVSNEAFKDMLSPFGLYVGSGDAAQLAHAVEQAAMLDPKPLRDMVLATHSLKRLVPTILETLQI